MGSARDGRPVAKQPLNCLLQCVAGPHLQVHVAQGEKRPSELDLTPFFPKEKVTIEQKVSGFTVGASQAGRSCNVEAAKPWHWANSISVGDVVRGVVGIQEVGACDSMERK